MENIRASETIWHPMNIDGIDGYFTKNRVDSTTIPNGIHVWELASNYPNGSIAWYEYHVSNNKFFSGTFITKDIMEKPITAICIKDKVHCNEDVNFNFVEILNSMGYLQIQYANGNVRYNATMMAWRPMHLKGVDGLFCEARIDPITIPTAFNIYECADDNHTGNINRYRDSVLVNFIGTFISVSELPQKFDGAISELVDYNESYYTGDEYSLEEICKTNDIEWKFESENIKPEDKESHHDDNLDALSYSVSTNEDDEPMTATTTTSSIIITHESDDDWGVETGTICEPYYGAECMICKEVYDVDMYETPKLICPTCIKKLRVLLNIEVEDE